MRRRRRSAEAGRVQRSSIGAVLAAVLAVAAMIPSQVRSASLDVGARVCSGSNCSSVGPGEGGGGAVFSGATGVGAQTSFATPPGSSPFIELSAGAAQDYGVFRARVELLLDTPYSSAGSSWGGSASGNVRDTWTITGGSGAGTLHAFFTVSGSIASDPSAGVLQGDLRIATVVGNGAAAGSTGPILQSGIYGFGDSDGLPFVFGVPFDIEFASNLGISVSAPNEGGAIFAAVLADFHNTAYLSAIEVYDDQGQPVPDFAITSESGTAYPVPEPDAFATGSIACAVLAMLSRRARRTPRRVARTWPLRPTRLSERPNRPLRAAADCAGVREPHRTADGDPRGICGIRDVGTAARGSTRQSYSTT